MSVLSPGIRPLTSRFYKFLFVAADGLSRVVRGRSRLAQRACGGSQGRLRAARATAGPALRATLLNPCRRPLGGKYVYIQLQRFLGF